MDTKYISKIKVGDTTYNIKAARGYETVTVTSNLSGVTLYIDGVQYTEPVRIEYGTSYIVSGSAVDGYTVESQTYTAGQTNRTVTITYVEIVEGVFAVTTSGDLVSYSNIDTNSQSSYVGVAIIDPTNNFSFFIDKRFPTGSAAGTTVVNYKAWSAALYGTDQSYLTNIGTASGDGNSISSAAPTATREAALTAYANGETGIANTNNLVADTTASSETAANNAAKYCRSIANPVTGAYDGYLGSLAEWIAVNDNQVEVNQILTAIGGVAFATTNSGYSSSGMTYTRYWTSSERSSGNAWFWNWHSSRSFALFGNVGKPGGDKCDCARPFFPFPQS